MSKAFQGSEWIWNREAQVKNEYSDFLAVFRAEEGEGVLRIAVETSYAVWLNGTFVGFGQYCDFPERKVYDSYTVNLRAGENRVAITAYAQNESTQTYVADTPSLIFEIVQGDKIVASSGENTLSRRSPAYFSGDMYKFTGQLGYAFRYYGDKNDGFTADGYKPGADFAASVKKSASRNFAPRGIARLALKDCVPAEIITQGVFIYRKGEENAAYAMQSAFLSHRELKTLAPFDYKVKFPVQEGIRFRSEEGDGIYFVVDLQEEQSGVFHIRLSAAPGTKIDVGFGEHLDDLRVRSTISTRCFAFEITAGEGITDYTAYLKRIGCRYLQLFVHGGDCCVYECSVKPTVYEVNVLPKEIGNPLRKKIYEVGIRTLRMCMHEHYEDCPWREQALYTFDSRIQMLCGYTAFEEYAMPRDSLLLMGRSLRKDGHLELCAPCRMPLTIPMFSLTYIQQIAEYVQYSGDVSLAEETFGICQKILETFLANAGKNGLIQAFRETYYWNFYEWSDGMDGPLGRQEKLGERYDAALNAFMVIALRSFRDICAVLRREYPAEYEAACSQISRATHEVFYDAKSGLYYNYLENGKKSVLSEFTNSVLLYAGIIPEDKRENVIDKILFHKPADMVGMTLSPMIYKYDAILRENKEKYLKAVLQDIDEIWGRMLYKGATTFWETQKGADDFYFAGSLCHGWSALPIHVYNTYGWEA